MLNVAWLVNLCLLDPLDVKFVEYIMFYYVLFSYIIETYAIRPFRCYSHTIRLQHHTIRLETEKIHDLQENSNIYGA